MERENFGNPPCSFCDNPDGGYAIYRDNGKAYCEACFTELKLPEIQAQYPDTFGTPMLILMAALGLYALAIVLQAIMGVATWIIGR